MTTPHIDDQRPGHYAPYKAVKNLPPSEECIPSLNETSIAQVVEGLQGIKTAKLSAQNARTTVNCRQCNKPRVVYSLKVLPPRLNTSLKRLIHSVRKEFECGCLITPDDDKLEGQVFTRMALTCSMPVENQYNTSKKFQGRCYNLLKLSW